MGIGAAISSCATCPLGKASGVGVGGRCPFVDRGRQAGQYIYLEGEPADMVWFIRRGTVVLSRTGGDGDVDSAHAVRGEGAMLGLEGLIGADHVDSARAVTDVRLCGAPRDTVDAWLGPANGPARTLLTQTISSGVQQPPRAASPDGRAVHRVARWILEQSHAGETPLVPRGVLANLLGMVPETLSRALTQLAKAGTITRTRSSLRIKDEPRLRELALPRQ